MSDRRKRTLLSTLAAKTTAIVSVTLVLTVVGVTALAAIGATALTEQLRSRMGYTVIMAEDAGADRIEALIDSVRIDPAVATVRYVSAARALERWRQATGDEDDIVALLGVNPFRPEIEVNVKAGHADVAELRPRVAKLASMPGVAEVRMQSRMIERINRLAANITAVGGAIALALLAVSVVLINNMVRLTIHARRFAINTMQLVGATSAYVRRPYIVGNMLAGLIAGLIADLITGALLASALTADAGLHDLVNPTLTAVVLISVPLLGMLICALAALVAVNRYLRLDHDSLFMA